MGDVFHRFLAKLLSYFKILIGNWEDFLSLINHYVFPILLSFQSSVSIAFVFILISISPFYISEFNYTTLVMNFAEIIIQSYSYNITRKWR